MKKEIIIAGSLGLVAGLVICYVLNKPEKKSNFSARSNVGDQPSASIIGHYKTTKLTNVWKEISEDGPLRLNSMKINSGHVLKGDIVTRTIEKGYKYSGTFDFLKVTDHKMGTGYILISDLTTI